MSIMFSSPGFFSMLVMGIIFIISIVGAAVWAIYHVASGKFRVEYEVATAEPKSNKKKH
ncbi:hypothetical protein [Bacillus horti]|uniref:Membrane protein n=1 Tax=Caldalkalibacillus horti TaxID=77523 RepID=A0ABT9W1C1_9BACI|nr:hypothetical protein [Bacillus horti]MDQ0167061.1 putative membrane protein [Bacillus horti]